MVPRIIAKWLSFRQNGRKRQYTPQTFKPLCPLMLYHIGHNGQLLFIVSNGNILRIFTKKFVYFCIDSVLSIIVLPDDWVHATNLG